MDLENLTIQELVKIEGFAERCQVARRFPLATMMVTMQRDHTLLEVVDKLPSILVRDEEHFIACLAGLEAESKQDASVKKAEAKPAAAAPAAKPAAAKPTEAEKPAEAVKPAEGRGAGRPPKAAAVQPAEIPDFDKLTNPELRDFCVKNSVIARVKKDMGNSKRESMIKWCKEHFGAPTAAAKPTEAEKPAEAAKPAEVAEKPAKKAEEKPAESKPAGPISPYEGLTAKELYCICKDRGLTVAERQEANVYIQALEVDDLALEGRELLKAANEAKKQAEAAKEALEKPAEIDITAVPVPEEETEEFDEWDDVPAEAEKTAEAAVVNDDDWDI